MSGTEGREGSAGKAIRGERFPQATRFQRARPFVVSRKSFRHLANLIQGLGTIPQEALLIERAMRAFHQPILLGMMRITDEHCNPEGMTKVHKSSREIATLWCSDSTRIAVQCHRSRQAV
jgi:hypothetical protein